MAGVFISYRREDSSGYAGRLFDILSTRFGEENIYMDLDTIKGGDNFETVIEDKIGQCDVLLAVIGERWLTITGVDGSRRLDMANDFVRLEIAKALKRGVRVIPVLVGGATMPPQDGLPNDLGPLSLRQAMDLRDAHFRADAEELMDELSKTIPGTTSRPRKLKSNRLALAVSSILAVAAIAGGILVFRHMRAANHPSAQAVSADVNGKWKASVTYDWGSAVYNETFNFEVTGSELSGTASFLGVDRGIFDGKIEGDQVRFLTKTLASLGGDDKTYQDQHYYKGTVAGDTIRFSMLTDSSIESHVPVYFTAKR